MIILPLLLALVQAAPPAAEPAVADSSNVVYAPSASLRSATATGVAGLPAAPVTVRFECLVVADTGAPARCFPLEGAAKPATTVADFEKRAAAWPKASASPAVAVALQRVLFTRVRPFAVADKPTPPALMLFSDTVKAGDAVTLSDPSGTFASSDLELDERPDALIMAAYYPPAALRASVGTRVKALCRILPSRKLFCRDASLLESDSGITPEMSAEFINATYQVFDALRLSPLSKAGEPVVGRDVEMRISFVMPGS